MPRLRLRLVPRDEGFFEMFVRLAGQIESAAELLHDLVSNFDEVAKKASRLHDMEHEGDEITHQILRRLNTTFVTPIDHEDIYKLASTLDDVLDHIDAAGDLLVLHKIERPYPEMKAQTEVLVQAARTAREALRVLPRYRDLPPFWVEINRLENDGDRIYRQATADLFGGEYDSIRSDRRKRGRKWRGSTAPVGAVPVASSDGYDCSGHPSGRFRYEPCRLLYPSARRPILYQRKSKRSRRLH